MPEPSRVAKSTSPPDDPPKDAAVAAASVAVPHRFRDNGGVSAQDYEQSVSASARSAGVSRPRAPSTPQTSATEAKGVELLALLHSAISREKRYPTLARRQRREGTATVSFSLSPSGDMAGINIDRSSGFRMLDTAALGAVSRVAPFKPAQTVLTEVTPFKVDVIFRLN